MKQSQVNELLYQALETEMGGVKVYRTALRCAQNPDLKEEWEKYLEQTENHEQILLGVFKAFGLDPATQTPGRPGTGPASGRLSGVSPQMPAQRWVTAGRIPPTSSAANTSSAP